MKGLRKSMYTFYPFQPRELEGFSLVPLRYEDIFQIKKWRNDQMDILRQKRELTDEDQQQYYENIVVPQFQVEFPNQFLFSYLSGSESIGYGGLTNIDWESRRAEVSFLMNTERIRDRKIYQQDFRNFLHLLKIMAFKDLNFHRLFTETYDCRPWHVQVLEENGFIFEGRMKDHVQINSEWMDSLIHGCLKEKKKYEK